MTFASNFAQSIKWQSEVAYCSRARRDQSCVQSDLIYFPSTCDTHAWGSSQQVADESDQMNARGRRDNELNDA